MTAIRRSRLWRTLSWLLTVAVVTTLVPVLAVPGVAQTEPARTILVLPAADQSGRGDPGLGRLVADQMVLALAGKPGLAALEFTPVSPQVRRAIAEGRLVPVQAEALPQTPAAAVVVAYALRTDAVLQMTIESLVVTEYPRQAKISLAGELYSVAANFNAQTGEAAATPQAERTFKVVGASAAVANYTGADRPLIREAIQDAVRQIAAVVAGEEAAAPPSVPRGKPSWIPIIIGVGLLALLVSGKGNSAGAPPGAAPPVPVSLNVEAGGIRLNWQAPPPTGLTLLKYQIQRSVDGAPYQSIDQGLVGAGTTTFFDSSVSTTDRHLYRYRIAAVYTNQAVSPYASFTQVSFP